MHTNGNNDDDFEEAQDDLTELEDEALRASIETSEHEDEDERRILPIGKTFSSFLSASVYEPQEDTYLLADASDEFAFGKVLEVGCGSGFIAVELAKNGLLVDACDVNPDAILATQDLAQREEVSVRAFKSDLFESVVDEYDTIVFNAPYLPEDEREPQDIRLATTGGKEGHEIIERFLIDAPIHLVQGGIILLLFSSLTQKEKIDQFIRELGYVHEQVREEKQFFESLYVYKISRAS